MGGLCYLTGDHRGLGSVLQTGESIEYLGYVGGLYYRQTNIGGGVFVPDRREHRVLGVCGGPALRTGERGVLLTWHSGGM